MNSVPALVASVAYLAVLVSKLALAIRSARRAEKFSPCGFADVTVLLPVVSGDPRLGEILRTSLRALDGAEFIWLVDEDDAPARELCAQLQREFPSALTRIALTPPPPDGHNPKLHKLAFVEREIRTRVVIVLDDDTAPTPAAGAALLGALPRCELATGLPFYLDGPGIGTRLVTQFVNNQAILTYLPLLAFHPPITINGMFYAMETAKLRALGGFAPQVGHVTDDFAMARLILNTGGRIEQTAEPHFIATTVSDAGHYVRLMHRWFVFASLLLRAQPLRWRFIILGLHGLPPLLLWLAFVASLLAPDGRAWSALAALVIGRAAMILAVQRIVAGRTAHAPVLSLCAELLQPFHLAHAACQRTILWRRRRIRVRADDDFDYV